MSTIHPSAEMLRALAESPDQGPVVMLNLLKFHRGGGSKAYAKYAAAFEPLLRRHGGKFLYLGRAAEMLVGDASWDAVALVQYPSRAVFAAIIQSPEYVALSSHRDAGLERTMLYVTDPRSAPVQEAAG